MISGLLRLADPTYPYRIERAWRRSADGEAHSLGWVRAPLAISVFTVAWQLTAAALAVLVPTLIWTTGPRWLDDLTAVLGGAALFLVGVGMACEASVWVRALRRREWLLALTGLTEINVLLALEYAFGPRRGRAARLPSRRTDQRAVEP